MLKFTKVRKIAFALTLIPCYILLNSCGSKNNNGPQIQSDYSAGKEGKNQDSNGKDSDGSEKVCSQEAGELIDLFTWSKWESYKDVCEKSALITKGYVEFKKDTPCTEIAGILYHPKTSEKVVSNNGCHHSALVKAGYVGNK